ncbi:MAG: cytochrome P450 [Litorilinea sp.]
MPQQTAIADLKLFGREFKANPYPVYARLRRDAPILRRQFRNPHGDDVGICFVTRYDDVAAMLRDTTHFVKNIANTMTPTERAAASEPQPLLRLVANHMLNQDAPDHTRLRSVVNRAFTVPMIEQLEPRITATAQELAQRMVRRLRMGESIDLINQFALPLPIIVIAELLGIPSRDHQRFHRWSTALISPTADTERTARKLEKSAPMIQDFIAYLRAVFARRRAQPAGDLISSLLHENSTGGAQLDRQLNEEELFSMLLLLIVVGHETTVNLIGNGALALLQQPSLWSDLGRDSSRIPAAVEEILRYDCPVERAPMRYAAQDMEWHGTHIRRGDHVSLVLGSANRDETRFPSPAQFRLDRGDNRHLAFGLGPHYCLGAPLARLEGRVAFEVLTTVFPHLTLATDPGALRWRPHPIMRGLTQLPVRLDHST